MVKNINPSIVLNCISIVNEVKEDHTKYVDPEGIGEIKKEYYRFKKRIYLKDIQSIEEYSYNDFEEFTDAPLCTIITYDGYDSVCEISFSLMMNILDRFDEQRMLIFNN